VNKSELIASMAEKTGLTKADSAKSLEALQETIIQEMKAGGNISLIGFGTFSLRERKERKGRNPKTGEEIQISASKSVHFSNGKGLKSEIN
jgi:DNA-binding protein HU-beta